MNKSTFLIVYLEFHTPRTGIIMNTSHPGCHKSNWNPSNKKVVTATKGLNAVDICSSLVLPILITIAVTGIIKNTSQPGCHKSNPNPNIRNIIVVKNGLKAIIFSDPGKGLSTLRYPSVKSLIILLGCPNFFSTSSSKNPLSIHESYMFE